MSAKYIFVFAIFFTAAVMPVTLYALRKRQRTLSRRRKGDRRRRNIAWYRSWNWLMNRSRDLRLTDQRLHDEIDS